MEELRAEVEKKSRMLLEIKGHLKQLAKRERERERQQSLVAKERDTLREQVKMVNSYQKFPCAGQKTPHCIGWNTKHNADVQFL